MTAEEAAELLEIFRRDTAEPPRIDPASAARAYIRLRAQAEVHGSGGRGEQLRR